MNDTEVTQTERIFEEHRGGYLLRLHGRFALHTDAQAAIDAYKRAYHPAGYGTHFVPIRQVGEYFVVEGTRGTSCD